MTEGCAEMAKEDEMYSLVCGRRFDTIEKKLDKLASAIMGNGKEGLVERVKGIEKDQEQDQDRWKILVTVSTALTVAVLGKLLYDFLVHVAGAL